MTTNGEIIRGVQAEDDFGRIHDLILETKRRASKDKRLNIRPADKLRVEYFPDGSQSLSKGFVAEDQGELTAFMGVHPRKENGIIDYGVKHYDMLQLSALLKLCEQTVLDRGGSKLFYFAATPFALLRNEEISVLERLGFVSEEYARLTAHLSPLSQWVEPAELDSSGIAAEPELELDDIYRMMVEDDNRTDADVFRHQFQEREPSHVLLTLRSESGDITAIAYYKVKQVMLYRDDLSALAFNIHFRPQFELHRKEKRRFLQAALHSMKQLDVDSVTATFSLRHFDTLTLLVQEGFDDFIANMLLMTKTLK